ncbi:uncharacterized protein MELLADRAFT_107781 [Melampsora larici-populina 98AG31]|uniref:Uncharacterized protein n=1 Tax=Melampsora larici-populina (strain 98AG31 / pathotype 3-4-7) TaxID=747676 RepID=F4RQX4_MELLP|nr:uncharacterized protein MELLADRAFT_107781 [Melampsora larici-populina 98AG31]EGG05247.1 hypothetical protein MELLADRAFT_107781 [Melampsora larici-populina 98AG31]
MKSRRHIFVDQYSMDMFEEIQKYTIRFETFKNLKVGLKKEGCHRIHPVLDTKSNKGDLAGCIFQYIPDYMKATPPLIEESKGKSHEVLRYFSLLNPTHKTNLPGNIIESRISIWSNAKVFARKAFFQPDLKDFGKYIILKSKVISESRNSEIINLIQMMGEISVHTIYIPFLMENFFPDIMLKGGIYDRTIKLTLRLLQSPSVGMKEHLWLLGLLKILKEQLPAGHLAPLREDIREGPICQGMLEFFYTQRLNLVHMVEKVWEGGISEATDRHQGPRCPTACATKRKGVSRSLFQTIIPY